jgi:hypothetical protein
MAVKAVSQADAEMASEMPDKCNQWLCTTASLQCCVRSLGCMRLAADPARA